MCSWSRRNQNRVCLQPRGWGGGGTVCSVTWGNYTQAPCHLSPELQSGAALKARRPTVSSRVKGSQGRGFGPSASEAMNSPTPAWKGRKGGWERKGPKQRGPFSTPRSPPHPVPARIPICVSASSPDGKPAQSCPKGTASPRDHCLLPLLCPLPLPSLLRIGGGNLGERPGLGVVGPVLRASNQSSVSLPCLYPSPSLLTIGSRLEARDKAGPQFPFPPA